MTQLPRIRWLVQSRADEHTQWQTIGYLADTRALEKLCDKVERESNSSREYDLKVVDSLGRIEIFVRGEGRKVRRG
jgi:hypothetical protein